MKGYYFFFFLSACLGILFINTKQVLFIGLNVLLLLYMYKKASIQPVLIMVGCFLFFCFYKTNSPYHLSTTYQSYQVKVKEVKETYCIVNYKDKFILLYTEEQEIFPNDLLSFEANLKKISKDSQLVGFEFQNYLKNKRVYYQFENINNFQILQRSKPLSLKITNFILSNLSNESQSFIALLLFNDRYIDPLAYDSLLQINALHLFVVSGFHFVFLFQLFNRIFSLFLKNKASYLSFCILFFYLYLLNFSISAFRSLFCLFFTFIDKKHRFTALDGLAFSGFILFLYEPLSIFNLSFIMSYSLAFILILSKKILKDKSKITQSFLLSFIAFMIMIPIQLSINYKINFISFFSNILLSPIVLILFIFSLLSICLSFIDGNLFSFIYRFFLDKINTFANQTQLLIFGKPSTFFILLYYIILFFVFLALEKRNIKAFLLQFSFTILILFINYNKNHFKPYDQVTFLDVYQGDCAIIQVKWGQGVMLIDTGGIQNYDIASKKIIPYLEYYGIKQIDLVVISHDDYDHNGALPSLKKQFIVKKVIDNPNIKKISLGSLTLMNLNSFANLYSDSNNQSIVLYGNIAHLNFLFTGDIDQSVEKNIIQQYESLPVDVLKVAHHGSKTSTSDEFLQFIQPKIAIISVGKNFYGHPSLEVIERLKKHNVILYQTNIHGGITFSYRYHFYYLKTAK